MPWIYIWTSPLKSAYVGTTPVKEIYVGTNKVRPSGWTPWANTIAYYPLDSVNTVNDLSGNGYNLSTSWTVTFTTALGVSSMLAWNWYLYKQISTIPVWANARTLSIWAYLPSLIYNKYLTMWFYGTRASRHKQQQMCYNTNDATITPYLSNYYDDLFDNAIDNTLPQWYNLIYTYDGSTQKLYNNGTLIAQQNITLGTGNNTLYIWASSNWWDKFSWNLSNLIIENKVRTAQEIADYYNQTKSNYWL